MFSTSGPKRPELCRVLGVMLAGLFGFSAAQGGINVSAGGQASYGLPIAVPPGIAGMAPNLSLSYVDGGINGPLGVGWSVQGISAITRCPASRVVDGAARSVSFDGQDKLCLDGQRLIQTDASGVVKSGQIDDAMGGGDGVIVREYRTEKDMFARIRAYGTAAPDPAYGSSNPDVPSGPNNGPQYFKVWTKSGQVYEYGSNPAQATVLSDKSTVYANGRNAVAVWAVRRISDVVGNYMDFKYHLLDTAWGSGTTASGSVGREWGIAEIQYTGNKTAGLTDQAPANKVVFSYEPKPTTFGAGFDRGEAYQWDSKNVSTYRINAIRAYVNSPNPGVLGPAAGAVMVRAYRLNYEVSTSTGRSRLLNIAECSGPAGAETKCLPPTVFSYTNAGALNFAANSSFGASTMSTLPMTATNGEYGVLTGDFNGDGRTDILRWSRTASLNELWLSEGNGTFTKSTTFNLTTQNLNGSNAGTSDGCYVGIVADFNGDGLSDILRVAKASCSTGGNLLFLSVGDGSFTTVALPAAMDLQQVLTKTYVSSAACELSYSVSPGGDTLSKGVVGAAPATSAVVPPSDNFGPGASKPGSSRTPKLVAESVTVGGDALVSGNCQQFTRPRGKRFYLIDLDGDGILDIVTTIAVDFSWNNNWGNVPSEDELCLGAGNPSYSGPCSRVWRGSASGAFTEQTTDVVNVSLYSDPPDPKDKSNPYWRIPNQADINGDGLQDILAKYTGRWRSMGNFKFTGSPVHDTSQLCGMPIDFNGDGRTDCLFPSTVAASQNLTLSYGAATSAPIVQFNLTGATDNLYAVNASGVPTVGLLVEDYDGDGRQDILRWGQTPSDNGIYLSNGDGSFRPRVSAGLGSINRPLQAIDGSTTFALGDFLGIGAIQILHLKNNPTANSPAVDNGNQLYFRSGQPVDVLYTATTSTGLVSTVGPRVPLSNSGGVYVNERGTAQAAVSPMVDIQAPMYVISSLTNQTGTPTDLTTNYLYKGLKAERGGRGILGFREVRQQNPAPNGSSITIATEYVQKYPYLGVAARSTTYLGNLSIDGGQVLSTTVNTYCDSTANDGAATNATDVVPCLTTARVTRPYLLKTVESGKDLNGVELPTITTTTTVNGYGDPTKIVVTTIGKIDSLDRTYTKTSDNTYCEPGAALPNGLPCPNNISDDAWILGRLTKSTVANTSPVLPSNTSYGAALNAAATQGNLTLSGQIATASASPLNLTFQNTIVGATSVGQVVVIANTGTAPLTISAVTASGEFSVVNHTCIGSSIQPSNQCSISVAFSPTNIGLREGTLTIVDNGNTGNPVVYLSGTGQAAAANTLSAVAFGNAVVGTSSTLTATLQNNGSTALSITAPTAGAVTGTDFSYVSTSCAASLAAGAACTVTVGFTPTAALARTGTLTVATGAGSLVASLSGTGTQGNASAWPAALTYASQTVGTNSAAQTVTMTNAGTAPLTISAVTPTAEYAVTANTCVTTLAVSATCTFGVNFTPAATGTRTGTVSIANNGSTGAKVISLSGTGVQGNASASPATLTYASQTVGTTSAAQTVTMTNAGTAPLTISAVTPTAEYAVTANTCVTTLAVNATCTFGVNFTPVATGTRTGTVTIANNGLSGAKVINLSGTGQASAANTLSAVAFGNAVVGTSATLTATLQNNGATALSITAPTAGAVTGTDFSYVSTTCAASLAAGAACTVTVAFAPTAALARTGTLTVATGAGSLVSSLSGTGVQGNASASPATLTYASQTVGTTSAAQTVTMTNAGTAPLTISAVTPTAEYAVTANTCVTTLAVNATCTFGVTFTPAAAGTRPGTVSVANSGSSGSKGVNLTGTGQTTVANTLSAVSFGSAAVGTTPTLTATLQNNGATTLNLTVPTAGSVTGTDFSYVSTTCAASLIAGGNCTVTVRFSPTAALARTGTLTVVTGAGNLVSSLSGTGIQGNASASVNGLTYASQTVGTTSAAQTVTMTNVGTAPLTISAVTPTAEYAVTANTCVTTLAVNATCTFGVTFTPAAAGTRPGTVSVANSGSSGSKGVNLTGTGQTAVANTLSAVSFGSAAVGTTPTLTATLQNNGATALSITAPTAGAVTGTDFSYVSTTCAASLAAGTACTVTVAFAPTAALARTGTLTVATGAGSLVSSLSGTGVQGNASASVNGLTYASQTVGTTSAAQTVTMTNAGTAPLTISAVTPTAEYAVTANTCVTTLAVNATCTFGVNFTPAATGTRTGTVTIANNGSTGSKVVNLTGTGQSLVSLSPNPVSFGQVQIGSGLSLNTTLTNAGAATISLTVPTASSVTGDDFAMSGTPTTCTTSLAAGASCTVRVRFNPTAAIGRTGTLTVITGAGNFSVSLSGTGTAVQQGDASLSPSTLMTFGPQTVGTTSAPQTVTITNIGTSFLAINQLIPSPEFGVTANTCLTTLAVGMTCTFGVSFTPGWTGLRLGALTVLSNGSSGVKSIPLNGTGN